MLYKIKPRIGGSSSYKVFGNSFTLCLLNWGNEIELYLEASVSKESLSFFFGVEDKKYDELFRNFGREVWSGEARPKSEKHFYFADLSINDVAGIVNSLKILGGLCIGVSSDFSLKEIYSKKLAFLLKQVEKNKGKDYYAFTHILNKRLSDTVLGKIVALSIDENGLKEIERKVNESSNIKLRWKNKKVKDGDFLLEAISPPSLSFWEKATGIANKISWSESALEELLKFPDPSLHRIRFVRGASLPQLISSNIGKGTFRVGSLENGNEFRLSIEDLRRHCYIIGQSGSGKTSFLKLLVHRIKEIEKASIILIDPHGDMAKELAEEIQESLYLHPIKSPFGLNPLDLPEHENREFAISIAIDALLEVFRDALKLVEGAINVKYLLQVVLRYLYSKTNSPTMADLYKTILMLYRGEFIFEKASPDLKKEFDALERMQPQTFISALSRLEPYANDKLLKRITSKTTIDLKKLILPGNITLFSIPKADLGERLARLIASTIVMRVWFEILARFRANEERKDVFLIIDEFQFISDLPVIETILSEARKYGLYLILAHQHTKQLNEELLQSILTNCAVKVVFTVEGEDIKKLENMDHAFAESVRRALSAIGVGKAVIKIVARPEEDQLPPVLVNIDFIEHVKRRHDIYTFKYAPSV